MVARSGAQVVQLTEKARMKNKAENHLVEDENHPMFSAELPRSRGKPKAVGARGVQASSRP